jgi:hypothetical protein
LNLSIDYDETYTRDPAAWNEFIDLMQSNGHNVYCVTLRHDKTEGKPVREALAKRVDGLFFTNRQAKKDFMAERGIRIDVWVDDNPAFILTNAGNPVPA